MESYNEDAKCPKCGGTDIRCLYHPYWYYGTPEEQHSEPLMHRFCRNCQFGWLEKPLDADEVK